MPRLLSCLSSSSTPDDQPKPDTDALLGTPPGAKAGCIFCDVSVEKGFAVVHADDELIAFHDRTPRARTHLLIIPRRHIDSVKVLTRADLPLLDRMTSLAHTLARSSTPPTPTVTSASNTVPRLGFHIPPFSSVPHLHLHVLVPPLTFAGTLKYPVSRPSRLDGRLSKGWGWFVEVGQVREILQRDGRVKVGRS